MPASLHVVDVVVVVVVVADENDEKKITSHVRERLTLNCVNEREMERERERERVFCANEYFFQSHPRPQSR